MLVPFLFSFLIAVLLSLAVTPLVIKFAFKIGATDTPNERKVHKTIMPRIGGVAIFLSALTTLAIIFAFFPELSQDINGESIDTLMLSLSFISIFALGFWDDLKPISSEIKFAAQFIIATVIYFAGFKISIITNPLGAGNLDVQYIEFPLTIIWIVGITNAFNLIDGLDGLAAGVATIACVSIFTVAAMAEQYLIAVIALIIAGSLVGFLRYNFNPAKIFLGDSGSLFIGFALALLAIKSAAKTSTGSALLFPILVLVFPIVDTLVSMARRLIGSFLDNSNSEKKRFEILHRLYGMFVPDKRHIHHRLLSMGLSHKNTVLVLYFVSAFFAFGAFLFTQIDSFQRTMTIAFVFAVILFSFIKKLEYHEIAIFNNGLLLPIYDKWILNRKLFLVLADIIFITGAYSLSYFLIVDVYSDTEKVIDTSTLLLPLVFIQLITFWITGIYKEKINQFSIGSALHVTRTVGYSIIATAFLFAIVETLSFKEAVQFLIFDFYFLLTLTLGFRTTYRALGFRLSRAVKTGENVLIYGIGEGGMMMLHKVTNSPQTPIKVIGFLADDPRLEDKILNGYPILGGHWNLSKIHRAHRVDTIYICDPNIKPENLARLKKTAYKNKIRIKELEVNIKEVPNSQSTQEKYLKKFLVSGKTSLGNKKIALPK